MEGYAHIVLWISLTLAFHAVVSCAHSVFGDVKDNITWFHSNLSVRPAMTASLEYHVQYPYVEGRSRPIITFYYNGQNSPNFDSQCETDLYGQLRNEDLAVPLKTEYRDKFSCYKEDGFMKCQGKTKIQDFEPKSYSFSLASNCGKNVNLNGLHYNVTIYDESNKTSCVDLNMAQGQRIDQCERSYQFAAIPNQIGNTDLDSTFRAIKRGLGVLDNILALVTHKKCLEGLYQIACLVVLPECIPDENKIVLPCREDCSKMLKDCLKWDVIAKLMDEFVVNCDYLPTKDGNISCYTELDICGPPPEINHGSILEGSLPYASKDDVIHYACNDSWVLTGSPNSTCQITGEWTTPPTCSKHVSLIMIICVSIGGFTLLVLLVTVAGYCAARGWWRRGRGPLHIDDADDANNAVNSCVINSSTDPLVQEIVYE